MYSQEEYEDKKQQFLTSVYETLQKFAMAPIREAGGEEAPYTADCQSCLDSVAQSYSSFDIGQAPYAFIHKYRKEVATALIEKKGLAKMCGIFEDGVKRRQFVNVDGNMNDILGKPMSDIRSSLHNYSDASDEMKTEICTHSSMLTELVGLLNDWQHYHLNLGLPNVANQFLHSILGILHNCGAVVANVPILRNLGVVQAVFPYMDSTVSDTPLVALFCLSNIVDEEELGLLQTHMSKLKVVMIDILKHALTEQDHRVMGWTAEELTRAFRHLARSGENKKLFVEDGLLPMLVNLLKEGNEAEVKEAVDCMWTLSLHPTNKARMVQETGLVHGLVDKLSTAHGDLKDACQRALLSLREKMADPDNNIAVAHLARQ